MTTKYITGNYANGYIINTKYSAAVVEKTVVIENDTTKDFVGLSVPGIAAVTNYGNVTGLASGVVFYGGGSFLNDAYVGAIDDDGVTLTGTAMTNLGTVKGSLDWGVVLNNGSTLINGSESDGSALVDGNTGVSINGATSRVTNFGTIRSHGAYTSTSEAVLVDAGALINGSATDSLAVVTGPTGVSVSGAGTVTNFGLINGTGAYGLDYGVVFTAGGSLTNGSAASHTALIEGYQGVGVRGAAGNVKNFGTINSFAASGRAVAMIEGGEVTNGAVNDGAALISGDYGVFESGSGAVTNFGTIRATAYGVVATVSGCVVTNGAATDPNALITGLYGVVSAAGAPTVVNLGSIVSTGPTGAILTEGGVVINGAAGDTTALIKGSLGVQFRSFGTVSNYATIQGVAGAGVYETGGGTITNGGGFNRGALIEGVIGVEEAGIGVVKNFGTIFGSGVGDYGVQLKSSGQLVNGSVNNATALIAGYGGAYLYGAAATNFGTIHAEGDAKGAGVLMKGGGSLTNGSAGHAGGLIEGYFGVVASSTNAAATVTNFGTILGQGGAALEFASASDVLNVEAGSGFTGSVQGDGGTLGLASGTGTMVLAGHDITVSGSMATTAFTDFDTVRIAAGASFKVSGNNTGALSVTGGTLTSDGTVSGTGHVNIDTGIADLGAGFEEAVDFTGTAGELKLGSSKTYTGKISGFSKTGSTSLDLLDIAFAGTTTAVYTGTTTSGVLTVTEGANVAKITMEGNYLASTFTLSAAPGGGTLVVDPTKTVAPVHIAGPAPPHQFIAAMAGFEAQVAGAVALDGALWRTPSPTLAATRALV